MLATNYNIVWSNGLGGDVATGGVLNSGGGILILTIR